MEGKERTDKISTQEISYANNVRSVRVKKDTTGNIWLVWEERESGKSDIYVAQLKNGRIASPISLATDNKGLNFSPSIDFSLREL